MCLCVCVCGMRTKGGFIRLDGLNGISTGGMVVWFIDIPIIMFNITSSRSTPSPPSASPSPSFHPSVAFAILCIYTIYVRRIERVHVDGSVPKTQQRKHIIQICTFYFSARG